MKRKTCLPKPQNRFVTLDGCINFRDFGNYDTSDGKKIKKNHLFRTSQLSRLSQNDKKHLLKKLKLHSILDLRTKHERQAVPSPPDLLDHLLDTHISFGLDPARKSNESIRDEHYVDMLDYARKAIKEALLWVFNNSQKPFVIHCMGGKDRTGVLAALLLKSLKVDNKSILEDYLYSRTAIYEYIDTLCQEQNKGFEELMQARFDVNEKAMQNVLEKLDTIMEPENPFSWIDIQTEAFLRFREHVLL